MSIGNMKELHVLVNEYLKSSSHAVAELYDRFKNQLFLLAYNYCRDKEIIGI